jgi:hypothetical protein
MMTVSMSPEFWKYRPVVLDPNTPVRSHAVKMRPPVSMVCSHETHAAPLASCTVIVQSCMWIDADAISWTPMNASLPIIRTLRTRNRPTYPSRRVAPLVGSDPWSMYRFSMEHIASGLSLIVARLMYGPFVPSTLMCAL